LLLLHRKIFLAAKVMREATKAVAATPATLLLPILSLVHSAVILAGAAALGALLLSTGDLELAAPGFGHLYVPLSTWGWFTLLGFTCAWLLCFVRHAQHAAIAGSLATWYFGSARWFDVSSFPCLGALRRVLSRHAGSIAFGSLLITLLQAVRLVVLLVMKRAKACAGDSKLANLACCCVSCVLLALERCVRYASRNAYIVMMIHGTSFCSSAAEALGLLAKHMVGVAVVRSVGSGFLFLGKLFIAAGSAALGAAFLISQPPYDTELFSIVPAVTAIFLGGWLVGTGFMSVYNIAVDTIFLCYTIDLERVKHGQPTAGPPSVSKLIDATDKEEAEAEAASAAHAAAGRGWRGAFWRRPPPIVEVSAGHLAEPSSTRQPVAAVGIEVTSSYRGSERDTRV